MLFAAACNKDGKEESPSSTTSTARQTVVEILADDLQFPWGLAYLPNGDLLFTERPGRLTILKVKAVKPRLLLTRQVQQSGEGGLLGIAVDPEFATNRYVYLYETASDNRVVRYRLENDMVTEDKVIVQAIPKAGNHNGGVIHFGPDGYLYVGTGDAQDPQSAQDLSSLAGKILRVDRDGNPAPGNPFGTVIYTLGHRNVQGITWTGDGKMIATEHGPSGDLGSCCHDEVNCIEKGKNYGWPLAHKSEEKAPHTPSIAESGNDTWAPSGCLFTGSSQVWQDQLVIACLRGQRFERFTLKADGSAVTGNSDTLYQTFGRLRNIVKAPDGSLVFCTSNGDDQILRIGLK